MLFTFNKKYIYVSALDQSTYCFPFISQYKFSLMNKRALCRYPRALQILKTNWQKVFVVAAHQIHFRPIIYIHVQDNNKIEKKNQYKSKQFSLINFSPKNFIREAEKKCSIKLNQTEICFVTTQTK